MTTRCRRCSTDRTPGRSGNRPSAGAARRCRPPVPPAGAARPPVPPAGAARRCRPPVPPAGAARRCRPSVPPVDFAPGNVADLRYCRPPGDIAGCKVARERRCRVQSNLTLGSVDGARRCGRSNADDPEQPARSPTCSSAPFPRHRSPPRPRGAAAGQHLPDGTPSAHRDGTVCNKAYSHQAKDPTDPATSNPGQRTSARPEAQRRHATVLR